MSPTSSIPLISVIVPVYNVEQYLQRCLDSIVNQTLGDIEIICVNDGTKDNSLSILNEYAKKDVRITVINKKNGGLASARNEGMKHAKAKYIAFVDSDDWIEPDTYELAYNKMKENNTDMVCWYARIEQEDDLLDRDKIQDVVDYYRIRRNGLFEVSDELYHDCTVTVWNKFFKREILERKNIVFPVGLLYEDNEFFYKYALLCRNVYFIDKYLYHYFQRRESIMWKTCYKKEKLSKVSMDRIKIMKNLYHFYVKCGIVSKFKRTISKVFVWDLIAWDVFRDNSGLNQLYVFWRTSAIVRKMNLSLLEDDVLNKLKRRKYAELYYVFTKKTLDETVNNIMRKNFIYRVLRKIYHKTQYYKTKTLQRSIDDINRKIEDISLSHDRRLVDINISLEATNRKLEEYSLRQEAAGLGLEATNRKLERKTLLVNRLVNDHIDVTLNELNNINAKPVHSNNFCTQQQKVPAFGELFTKQVLPSPVIEELTKLDGFIFCPNNGNLGDVIIAEAEYQLFAYLGLKYAVLDLYNTDGKTDEEPQYSNYVYGGGGLFHHLYDYSNIVNSFKSDAYRKVIILPSSFYRCDELFSVLDERFVVFCREERSYKYCISMNKKARFVLFHDMAFNLNCRLISESAVIPTMITNYNKKYSCVLYEAYSFYKITSDKITNIVNKKTIILKNGQKLGIMLRTDNESNIPKNEKHKYIINSIDLSSFGWITCTDAGMVKVLSFLFIAVLNYFDIIITDRLHIGIVSAILGKNVCFLDNNYGKLSGVYAQSMRNFSNVRLYNSISEIEKTITENSLPEQDNINKQFNMEISFQKFLAVYFSAHNPQNISTKTFLNTITDENY